MEKFSGVKREDVLGKNAFELFPNLKETGEDKLYQEAVEGKTVVGEGRLTTFPRQGVPDSSTVTIRPVTTKTDKLSAESQSFVM